MSKQPDQVPTDDEIYVVEAWKKRAELAQAEINELKKEIAYLNNARKDSNGHILSLNQKVEKLEIENKTMEHNNVWLNKQYAELESKLTDYENPNYVLVPRTPNKKMLKEMRAVTISNRAGVIILVRKRMIEC